ncbi:MAG: ABC transporter ATP-binding protein [Demequinaceae bacterium]|nr:ABC transporter ATP-binding protein [Demequinaceae bacterium]
MKELWRGMKDALAISWEAGRFNFIVGFTLMLVQPVALPVAALTLRDIVDESIAGNASTAVAAAVFTAVLVIASLTAEHFAHIFYFKTAEDCNGILDRRVARLTNGSTGLEHHERADHADRLAVIRREIDRAAWGTTLNSYGTISILLAMAVTGFLLAQMTPWLLFLPIAAIPPLLLGRRAESLAAAARRTAAPDTRQANHMFALLSDAGPIKEVRTCGLEVQVRERQRRAWDRASEIEVKAEMRATLLRAAGQIFFAIAYVGATLLVVRDAVRGSASVGEVLMVVTLAGQVNVQVSSAVRFLQGLQRTSSLFAEIRWIASVVEHAPAVAEDASVPESLKEGIVFKDVAFAYPGTETPVLENVDLIIPAGSTVAIVGENGAGKSTLIKLLCRFYEPTAGVVEVDGTDLRRIPIDKWRERIAAGFQDFARYEFAAQHTVGIGSRRDIDDPDAVRAALDRARAEDVLRRLPDGLETFVGKSFDTGTDLSGGQWQKLALGRAMMRVSPLLLLLDEPTSALDAQAEHNLFEQYALGARRVAQATGAITVLVSHRFSTVRMADFILVVGDGRIVEAGTHNELMALDGLYADLYGLQARQYA